MLIIKIGGGKEINLKDILQDLKNLKERFIVVHGANYLRNWLARKLNQSVETLTSLKGYTSVRTDKKAIDLFLMAYAGLKNKRIVELAQKEGINAVGLTGLDGGLIKGERNKKILAKIDNKIKVIKDDYSGKPKEINLDFLEILLKQNLIPFICPPILSYENEALNTENDSIVSLLAKEINQNSNLEKIDKIINLSDVPGLLKDPKDETSLIEKLNLSDLESSQEYAKKRMKRKLLSLKEVFDFGVKQVFIGDGRIEKPIQRALKGQGTIIIK
jgi:acetylglutamate/LysW-gamma-L-alpha-aminoadipate kinase